MAAGWAWQGQPFCPDHVKLPCPCPCPLPTPVPPRACISPDLSKIIGDGSLSPDRVAALQRAHNVKNSVVMAGTPSVRVSRHRPVWGYLGCDSRHPTPPPPTPPHTVMAGWWLGGLVLLL
jgi:hypothetical protein